MAARSPDQTAVVAAEAAARPWEGLAEAARELEAFLRKVPPAVCHVLLCHSDADGLAAGVIFLRALERSDRTALTLMATGKGESAWSAGTLRRLDEARPAALLVLDLGSRPKPIFPGIPTLLVDHHRPLGIPPGARLISAYAWQPVSCTAALVYWLGGTLAELDDLDWVAALGIIGDLGEHAMVAPLPQARARYGSKLLREAASLINAARRSATGDASLALTALLRARGPADIAEGRLPEARQLAALRQAFNEALADARQVMPVFSGKVALIRVQSPYLVHPVLAQIWRGRLPNHIIMAANEGYLPGRVNFSLRTALDVNLLDFLAAFRQGLDATELGYGHDKAMGGSLSQDDWKRLLATLGFRRADPAR